MRSLKRATGKAASGIGFMLLLFGASAAAERKPLRPNVIVVLVDDLGYADFSCYGGSVKTPNVDRLAAEGIRFTQYYANSPICSPSRAALTTGQYPIRWGITSYLDNRELNRRRGMAQFLDPKAPSLARFLKAAGYRTAHFGKWHLGGGRDVGEAPLPSEYGFDASLTQFEGLGDRVLPLIDDHDGRPPRRFPLGVASEKLGRGNISWVDRSQVTKAYVDRTLEFIRESESANAPFYINLWPDDVHSPFHPPAGIVGDGSKRARFEGVLANMDAQLGPLFDTLRSNPRLRANTLVLVTSDNGPEPGAGSAGAFRGAKAALYEGGIRAPLIVWSPRLIPESRIGAKDDTTVLSSIDLVPSILKLAGLNPKAASFDGQDMSGTLLGKPAKGRASALFWKRPPDRPGPPGDRFPDLAIRDGNWKLLVMEDGSGSQLYNLAADPSEQRNLAESAPKVAERLTKRVTEWNRAMPDGRPPHIVLFLSDDHTFSDCGPYGAKDVRTPNLDRLMRDGIRFDRAYAASPTCTPSRSALYTGLYPFRNGAHANHSIVNDGLASLPERMKALNYRVVLAGKTHIGPRAAFPFEYLAESNVMPPGRDHILWTDLDTGAVDRLLASHDKAQPLCLIVCSHSPHVYWPEQNRYVPAHVRIPAGMIDTPATREARARYYADLSWMDHQLGAVRNSLERHGFAPRTLFIYASDQGAQWPFGKWNLYEAGIRTPLIAAWPGRIRPGTKSEALVSLIDLLPTFMEAASAEPPKEIDGRGFLSVLLGSQERHRNVVFASHTGDGRMNRSPMRCVVTDRFKYILNLAPANRYQTHIDAAAAEDGRAYFDSWRKKAETDPQAAALLKRYHNRPREELYDLAKDPHEQSNLAADPAYAATVRELREKLREWRIQQGENLDRVPMPEDARRGDVPYAR